MVAKVSRPQLRRHGPQLFLHGAIDHVVADGDARAADQLRIHDDRRLDLSCRSGARAPLVSSARSLPSKRKRASRSSPWPRRRRRPSASRTAPGSAGSTAMRSASISTRTKLRPSGVELVAADRQQQRLLRGGVEQRIVERLRRSAGRRRRGSRAAASATTPAAHCCSRASENAASAYGRAMVASSAMACRAYSSRFSCASSSACACASTSLLQDLRGAGDREVGDRVAQLFLRARDLLLDLRLGRGDDAAGFGFRVDLRLLDRLGLELLADRDDFGRPRLGFGQHLRVALFGAARAPCGPARRRRDHRRSASAGSRWRASAAAR